MDRPFIEFVQSQRLPWVSLDLAPPLSGWRFKILSEDARTGASTLLARLPPGPPKPPNPAETPNRANASAFWCESDLELFVLQGGFAIGDTVFGPHHYAYWPSGHGIDGPRPGPDGAVILLCATGPIAPRRDLDRAVDTRDRGLVAHLDPLTLPWDQTAMDPHIGHLNAFRKNLRLGPRDQGRTYLLAGLPQGAPRGGEGPLERHPHVEEMFMVAGDMPCSRGVMRAGAYFWRPPGIWHGADCTRNGFLVFMRTPGTNRTISEWADAPHPIRFDPAYDPALPDALRPYAGEWDDPTGY